VRSGKYWAPLWCVGINVEVVFGFAKELGETLTLVGVQPGWAGSMFDALLWKNLYSKKYNSFISNFDSIKIH